MLNRVVSTLISVVFSISLFGQSFLEMEWRNTYDIAMQDSIYWISQTSGKQYILAGNSDPMTGVGTGIMIAKLDEMGNMVWDQFYQKEGNSYFRSIVESGDGGYMVLGETDKEANNIWVFMIDNAGKITREKKFGLSNSDVANQILVDEKEAYYICGSKLQQGDGDRDSWIFKLDKKGNMDWQGVIGKRYLNDEARSMILNPQGGLIIAGYTETEKINGPKIPNVVKVDVRGNAIWEEDFPELRNYTAESVYLDGDGFIVVLAVNRASDRGNIMGVRALRINQSGKLIGEYDIPNPRNSVPRVYTVQENRLVAIYEKLTPGGEHDGNIIVRLDENFKHIWRSELDEKDIHLLSIISHRQNEYIVAGWAPQGSPYKTDAEVLLFSDHSDQMVADYIETELPVWNEKRPEESDDSYQARLQMKDYEKKAELALQARIAMEMLDDPVQSEAQSTQQQILADVSPVFRSGSKEAGPIISGKYYALLIAINDYDDQSITDLDQPIKDAQRLYDVLIDEYLFEKVNVNLLKNPTREEIINALDRFEGVIKETDNLLVFYAGHGYWDEKTQKGYWLPSNASQNSTANWIRNSSISGYIRGIKSKHTLLIADACFSGSIFKTRSAFGSANMAVDRLNKLPSRKAMTSGTLKEVPDKSVFVEYLVKRLYENDEQYLPSEQLFFSFKPAVLNNSGNIPQFGEIKDAGDEGGDFIFIRK
ncbi:caspase domain-containing protein [Bacteroidota bacterium]